LPGVGGARAGASGAVSGAPALARLPWPRERRRGALSQRLGCATGAGGRGGRGAAARLLHLEHVLVEVLLQLLVRQVDAELLEVVLLEALEACARQGRGSGSAR